MKKRVLFRVGGFYLLSLVIFALANALRLPGLENSVLFSITLATLGTYMLSLIFLSREGLSREAVGLAFGRHSLSRFICGLAGGLLMASLQPLFLLAGGHFRLEQVHQPAAGIVLQLIVYLAAACREDLAFHGYPLRRLDQQFGPWVAQVMIFMLFALEHKITGMSWLAAFFGAGIGSLLFGLASLKSRGLSLPLGLHFAWNTGQWLFGFKNTPGLWRAVIEPGYSVEAELPGYTSYWLAVCIAAIIIYFYYRHETNRPDPSPEPPA